MTIRDYIMLSALLFVCGTAGAQDLKWSDFTVTDTLSSPSALLFRWDAKKTTVTKDKIKYRYTSIQSNLVSAMIRPECQTTEELLHCQTLADFSRAWALALQDTLISVTNKADKVVSDYKARSYFKKI